MQASSSTLDVPQPSHLEKEEALRDEETQGRLKIGIGMRFDVAVDRDESPPMPTYSQVVARAHR